MYEPSEEFKKSNCYKHAISEFKMAGYDPIENCEDDPNKWIQENVLELLEVFSKQGHSGFSAPYCIKYFKKLANFECLTGIMCLNEEFNDVGHCYQNRRNSAIFKKEIDSKPYYLDAIVWRDSSGSCFTGEVDGVTSRQYIKSFPFIPKTFYIDVESWEVNKETNEPEVGSGWWESKIKDRDQLKEVFDYYDFYNK